jgi:GxxExxY protein
MPIHCRIPIPVLEIDAFKSVDYRVMGHAFACQNDLGRACDEGPYEKDLVARLLADGFCEVHSQLPIYVTHGDFSKTYFIDLIVDGALYELKAVSVLGNEHKSQLLNYMLLLDLRCGKLLNFQSEKVQGQLVVSGVTADDRRAFSDNATRWKEISRGCVLLRTKMLDLLTDWGAFLEAGLYHEALTHFLGGYETVVQRVPLTRGQCLLGSQRMHVIGSSTAFVITAFTKDLDFHEQSLQKLLRLTPLDGLQWINLHHAKIQFITLRR